MKMIVAAVDFSDSTPTVLAMAKAQAAAFGAEVHVVHVLEPEPAIVAVPGVEDPGFALGIAQKVSITGFGNLVGGGLARLGRSRKLH